MSLFTYIKPMGPHGFGYASTAEDVTHGLSLAGKTFLVTGCNSGLGFESMRVLLLRGAQVIATARTLAKAQASTAKLDGMHQSAAIPLACDLSAPRTIRACIAAVNAHNLKIDGIICNAGIMALPKLELANVYEQQFFTNHIGHFILVTGLTEQLSETGRVVVVSSIAHMRAAKGGIEFDNLDGTKGYNPWRHYAQAKFANILFVKELARRFSGTNRTANAVHPGVVRTNLDRNNLGGRILYRLAGPILVKNVAQGAATQMFVATHPAVAAESGNYFADCMITRSRPDTNDPAIAKKLWEISEHIVQSGISPAGFGLT